MCPAINMGHKGQHLGARKHFLPGDKTLGGVSQIHFSIRKTIYCNLDKLGDPRPFFLFLFLVKKGCDLLTHGYVPPNLPFRCFDIRQLIEETKGNTWEQVNTSCQGVKTLDCQSLGQLGIKMPPHPTFQLSEIY